MKQFCQLYSLDTSTNQLTMSGINIPLSQMFLVQAKGLTWFSLADGVGAVNYTQGPNSVITLQTTTGLLSTDPLTIVYEDGISNSILTTSVGTSAGAVVNSTTALATSLIIKASPGTLISLCGYNSKASAQFIQLHNTTSLPSDAAIPIYSFTVPAASNFSLDVPVFGIPFTTGIVTCNSSTVATKTIGAADCWFTAVVK